ncbi:MAG TPA: flagellin FliC [Candidatus Adamsella sp.]|nr:flagellin FliC [Candidatus Adamsella sp.]
MSIVVNTNTTSLMVQRNLSKATSSLATSMQRLSTGMKINNAGDDAAGLALSEKINGQLSSSDVCKNNAQTGLNMLSIADGDLDVINQNLQRIKDLAVQSANGVYSDEERLSMDQEVQLRLEEINRIADSSSFSDMNLLDGSIADMVLQIGAGSDIDQNTIDISGAFQEAHVSSLGIQADASISTVDAARTMIDAIDEAVNNISSRRSIIGASMNRLDSTIDRIDIRKENLQSTYSTIRDTDIAAESSELTKQQILQQSAATLLQQANQTPSLALTLI